MDFMRRASEGVMSIDPTDDFIEHCVTARERDLSRAECLRILHDVFNAPWASECDPAEPVEYEYDDSGEPDPDDQSPTLQVQQ
jgi:hypothetical protein